MPQEQGAQARQWGCITPEARGVSPPCESPAQQSDQSCKSQLYPALKNSPSPPSIFLSHLPSRRACPHAAQDLHLLRSSKSLLDLVHSALLWAMLSLIPVLAGDAGLAGTSVTEAGLVPLNSFQPKAAVSGCRVRCQDWCPLLMGLCCSAPLAGSSLPACLPAAGAGIAAVAAAWGCAGLTSGDAAPC